MEVIAVRSVRNRGWGFSDYLGSLQSIVTSSAQNDNGLFETNLREVVLLSGTQFCGKSFCYGQRGQSLQLLLTG